MQCISIVGAANVQYDHQKDKEKLMVQKLHNFLSGRKKDKIVGEDFEINSKPNCGALQCAGMAKSLKRNFMLVIDSSCLYFGGLLFIYNVQYESC